MLRFIADAFRRFRRDERGNVFILFGASAVPLILIMGGAVDFSRYTRYKHELSNGIDAAALALARQKPDATEAEGKTFVQNYVNSLGIPEPKFTINSYNVTKLANGFRVTTNATMQTIFLPLGKFTRGGSAGLMTMGMDIAAEVVSSSNRLEVALVLDVTGSMNCGSTLSSSCTNDWETPSSSSRIVALRSAAQTLVNILMPDSATDPSLVKIGVVPFEGTVNIGATYAANPPSWVDWNNTASAYWNGRNFDKYNFSTGTTCTTGTGCVYVGHKWIYDQLTAANSSVKWAGCVEMRNAPYDILDTTPTTSTPDTLFVPFLWPDEPDRYNDAYTSSPDTRVNSNYTTSSYTRDSTSGYYNYSYADNYLADKWDVPYNQSPSRPAAAQSYLLKYKYVSSSNKAQYHSGQLTASTSFPYSAGPNRGCPQAIVPLTSTKSTITSLLSNLVAYPAMGTFIPVGLVWGWHLVTPNAPFTEGVSSTNEHYDDTTKAIVLFTDGDNSVTGLSNQNESYFSAYNYVSQNRMGSATDADVATAGLDTKTASLCNNIKAWGDANHRIRVYTITFGTISDSSKTMMSNCASVDSGSPLYYHAPSTTDLNDIFRQIGEDLAEIHLSS